MNRVATSSIYTPLSPTRFFTGKAINNKFLELKTAPEKNKPHTTPWQRAQLPSRSSRRLKQTLSKNYKLNSSIEATDNSKDSTLSALRTKLPIEDLFEIPVNHQRIWVKQKNYVWMPVDLNSEEINFLSMISSNNIDCSKLPKETFEKFVFTEVLTKRHLGQPQAKPYMLNKHGFEIIPNILTSYQLEIMRFHILQMRRFGQMRLGDRDSPNRAWTHNDTISRWIHVQLGPYVNESLGTENIMPMFTKTTVYLNQAELPVHRDKFSYAYSFSVPIFYTQNEEELEDQWALGLEKLTLKNSFYKPIIGLGNGLIFEGARLEHYRKPLEVGTEAAIALLNFQQKNQISSY